MKQEDQKPNSEVKDYAAFCAAMVEFEAGKMGELPLEEQRDLARAHMLRMFGLEAPETPILSVSEQDRVAGKLYPGLVEIIASFQTLQDIPAYLPATRRSSHRLARLPSSGIMSRTT